MKLDEKTKSRDVDQLTSYVSDLADLPPDAKEWFAGKAIQAPDAERHYSLSELEELVLARKSWGEFWELPKHLSSCPACFDSFEILLKGDYEAEESILEKMRGLHPPRRGPMAMVSFEPFTWIKAVAAVAVIALSVWLAFEIFSAPSVRILEGELALSDGLRIASGSRLPDNSDLIAVCQTTAVFDDDSKLILSKDSLISLPPTRFRERIVQMLEGDVVFEISKQKKGQSFKVLTPAGEITVVGTKFSVASRMPRSPKTRPDSQDNDSKGKSDGELQFLHPLQVGVRDTDFSGSSRDHVVTVRVDEGVVIVRNRHGAQDRLSAGQTAVIRSGMTAIDVFEADSKN